MGGSGRRGIVVARGWEGMVGEGGIGIMLRLRLGEGAISGDLSVSLSLSLSYTHTYILKYGRV